MSNMNILPIWFIYVASIMRISGGLASVSAILRGEARPNPVSWLLWSLTPIITFTAGVRAEGFHPESIITLAMGLSPLLVFFVTIFKNPRSFRFDRLNATCFFIALAGIGLWMITDHPLLAVVLALSADIVSVIPTLAKTFRHPYSEYLPGYFMSMVGTAIAVLAMPTFNFYAMAFPVYAFIVNGVIVAFVLMVRAKRKNQIRRGIAEARNRKRLANKRLQRRR